MEGLYKAQKNNFSSTNISKKCGVSGLRPLSTAIHVGVILGAKIRGEAITIRLF